MCRSKGSRCWHTQSQPSHRLARISSQEATRDEDGNSQKVRSMMMFAALKCALMSHEVLGKYAIGVP